jgi:hypothetical protein
MRFCLFPIHFLPLGARKRDRTSASSFLYRVPSFSHLVT